MEVVVDLSAFFGGRESVPCSPSADGDTTTAHSRTVSEMGFTSGLDTFVGRLCPVSRVDSMGRRNTSSEPKRGSFGG